MSEIRQTGKTVEDAIDSALEKLNALREQVDVQVITKGKKGFLGFGAQPAEVVVKQIQEERKPETTETVIDLKKESTSPSVSDVTSVVEEQLIETSRSEETLSDVSKTDEIEEPIRSNDEIISETTTYIQEIITEMGVEDLEISHETDGKVINFQLESEKAAFLIGKRGATLNALQQLAQLVANKGTGSYKVVRIDVGDYRIRREQSLEQLADRMADKAIRTGRKVQLEPMPSNERKVLHNALADRLEIETYSEGKDPRRYLVIEPII